MSDDTAPTGVLEFRHGIPGFPNSRRFLLADLAPDSVFSLLRSLDEPDVAMVVTVPWVFFPEYAPELDESQQAELGLEQAEDAIVFCPVTLDPAADDVVYLNLLGPFIVNARTLQGRQVVLADSAQPVRAPVSLGD